MSRQRDGYKRIVVFQPRSGFCVDLGPSHILAPRFDSGESYFASSAGTNRAVSRTRTLEIPVIDRTKIEALRAMHYEGCEIRAVCVGHDNNIIWDRDSEINLVSFRGGPRSFTGERLVLQTDIFWGSVYQAERLLDGAPWYCQDATLDSTDNNYYLPGPSGYQGNRWLCSGSTETVTSAGVLTGSVTLTMYFPLQSATVQLLGGWVGSLKTLDFSGATLTTTNKTLMAEPSATIDDGTWKIEINATVASAPPRVEITDVGDIEAARAGVCIDCTDLSATAGSAPSWSS